MARCDACEVLSHQDKSAEAHTALVLVSKINLGRASRGQTSGFVHQYKCKTCGTMISCDGDDNDDAGWYISKES